eukprot:TRINITY_DN14288_c0_g1_i2.p2 TRINITY_DN14288_c0_g1~~TRINITY_DN14288_c0_g1_i2.p2  ORF type:complete len:276 (+),score=132.74 TRINITY_DN14288_c0_g1_i2:48-875(+)
MLAAMGDLEKAQGMCGEAQAAMMEAVYCELQTWKALAAYGADAAAGRKRSREEREEEAGGELEAAKAQVRALEAANRALKAKVAETGADLAAQEAAAAKAVKKAAAAEADLAAQEEAAAKAAKRVQALEERPNAEKLAAALKKCEAREKEALRLAEKYRSKRRCLGYVLEARQEITSLCSAHPEVKQKLAKVMARWKNEYTNVSPDREGSVMSTGFRAASRRREGSTMPGPSPFMVPQSAAAGFMRPPSRSAAPSMSLSRAEVLRKLTYDDFSAA